MLALVCIDTAMVLLLALLVGGLLRSHADILRSLHDLGAGTQDRSAGDHARHAGAGSSDRSAGALVQPPPPGRDNVAVADLSGVTPGGDAIVVGVGGGAEYTLMAFLSSGCLTCSGFWEAFQRPAHLGLPPGVRLVIVTKDPSREVPTEIERLAPAGVPVVMTSEAWGHYEVPGSPFFVLVDGRAGRRIGEGSALRAEQVANMVRQAVDESDSERSYAASHRSTMSPSVWAGDREREQRNDEELMVAGIVPGHPSLYPTSLEDIIAGGAAPAAFPPAGLPNATGGTSVGRSDGPTPSRPAP